MQQGTIVELDDSLVLIAAKISSEKKLPMEDSIFLATARQFNAIVWAQDSDFVGLDDVECFEKQAKTAKRARAKGCFQPEISDRSIFILSLELCEG